MPSGAVNAQPEPARSWASPDPLAIYRRRATLLQRLRSDPRALAAFKLFYRDHPAAFVNDWGVLLEPRATEGAPTVLPFALWPRQSEFLAWTVERWKLGEPGICEKARDSGVSWLCVALACTLCLFNEGLVIGFGSRKLEYVDAIGAPKALFSKARFFLSHLPVEFLGGWTLRHAPYCRILFPATGSAITGEGGDGIGRGDRTSLYFIDESAFLEHPEETDASLAQTTRCRIDISTPNGMGNSFARRRHSGNIKVFEFDWRHDPRKSDAWLAEQQRLLDPVIVAREILRDYLGSVENQLIPAAWAAAAVDAHRKLAITPTGMRFAALDVADVGSDSNSFCGRHGILVRDMQSWSGVGSDLFKTTARALELADQLGYSALSFDAIGVGSAMRGDAEQINSQRTAADKRAIQVTPFVASASPTSGRLLNGRDNADSFLNLKAEAWWALRERFRKTYDALQGRAWVADELISLDGSLPELTQLLAELAQVQFSLTATGKIAIDKIGDGQASPNRADSLMMTFDPGTQRLAVWAALGRGDGK